jgi:hypothetical protein
MRTDSEIEALVRAFEDGSLPRADWTHHAHLTVALWYLRKHPKEEATRLVSEGIRRYNASHGNPDGYHETVTQAWVAVIARFLGEHDRGQPLADLARALLDLCVEKGYLLRYYSQEVLMSDEARRAWVPPDLRPIEPVVVPGTGRQ